MTEPKHFSYDGNVHLKDGKQVRPPSDKLEVIDVVFLTPARITVNDHGEEVSYMVSVDIINRKVYDEKGRLFLSDKVFEHLDNINTLPEDFFAAPEEVYEKVNEAEEERLRTSEQYVGVEHE